MLVLEIMRIVFEFSKKNFKNFIKILEISVLCFIVFTVHCIEGKSIRESIY